MSLTISSIEPVGNQILSIKDCLQIIGIQEITNNVYAVPKLNRFKKKSKASKIPEKDFEPFNKL